MPAGANRCPEGGSHTTLWAGAQPVSRTQAPAGHEEDANDNAAPRGGSRPPPRPCPQPVRSIGGGGGGAPGPTRTFASAHGACAANPHPMVWGPRWLVSTELFGWSAGQLRGATAA